MSWEMRKRYRMRLAGERGAVVKDPGGRIRVAAAYPNRYHLGMSNLGFQFLYGRFNDEADVVCERVFLPDPEERAWFEESGAPLLTLESQVEVFRNHIVAFSVSFENDYIHILTMLRLARLPLYSAWRTSEHPLVICGGVAVSLNPEPLAPYFDMLALGEGESLLPGILSLVREIFPLPDWRAEWLRRACKLPGMYVPSFYREHYGADGTIAGRETDFEAPDRIELVRRPRLTGPPPHTTVLTADTEFSDMTLVELGKGCGRGCRFCAAGYVYRPFRPADPDQVRACVAASASDSNRFGLVSPALGDIPDTVPLIEYIRNLGASVSTSSLRGDAADERLLRVLRECGQTSVAIAPEAGSQRLRDVLNKKLREEDILNALARLADSGMSVVKLYFMVGLPTETREDVEAISELIKRMVHVLKRRTRKNRGIPRLAASVNCFVPKPQTPFQWEPMDLIRDLKEKIATVKRRLKGIKGVSFSAEVPKWAYVQAFLSLADRRSSQVLDGVHARDGRWFDAFRSAPLNPDFFVHRRKEVNETLPWDFIDTGVRKDYLWEEHERALDGKTSPDCIPDTCRRCGLCAS